MFELYLGLSLVPGLLARVAIVECLAPLGLPGKYAGTLANE